MTEIKISQLSAYTSPLDATSLLVIDKPLGGGAYETHSTTITDLFTAVGTTIQQGDVNPNSSYQGIASLSSSYNEIAVYGDYPNSQVYAAISADANHGYVYSATVSLAIQGEKGTYLQTGLVSGTTMYPVRVLSLNDVGGNNIFEIYNKATGISGDVVNNAEWATLDWTSSSNIFTIGTKKSGTGTARGMQFITDSTVAVSIDTSQRVGIGNSAPESNLHIGPVTASLSATGQIITIGSTFRSYALNDSGGQFISDVSDNADGPTGLHVYAIHTPSANIINTPNANALGLDLEVYSAGTHNVRSLIGQYIYVEHDTTGTAFDAYGVLIDPITKGVGAGTIPTVYGILIQAQAAGTTNYAIYTAGNTLSHFGKIEIGSSGAVLLGATSGSVTLKVAATAGSNILTFPAGTTDFSTTGGTSQVVKQTSAGGAFTVGQLGASDLSGGIATANGILKGDGAGAITAATYESDVGIAPAHVDLDFVNGIYWNAPNNPVNPFTVTRAGTAYIDDASGLWTSVPANTLRRSNKGALIEESRTNSVRNNSMQGAVAGSPGTMPTNWIAATPVHALTRTIIGVGTDVATGIDYIDIRWNGTVDTASEFAICQPEPNTQIVCVNGQTFRSSCFFALVGGSFTNLSSLRLRVRYNDSGGSLTVAREDNIYASGVGVGSTLTRIINAGQGAISGSTAFVSHDITLTATGSGVAIDFTLRIGWPQIELGSWVSSPIRTTTVAVTRAADVVTMNLPPSIGAAYTIAGAGTPLTPTNFTTSQALASISDGTTSNRLMLSRNANTGRPGWILNATTTDIGSTAWAQNAAGTAVTTYAVSNQAGSFNGGVVTSDSSATTPTGLSIVGIGYNGATGGYWNGYISRILIWPQVRLGNQVVVDVATSLPVTNGYASGLFNTTGTGSNLYFNRPNQSLIVGDPTAPNSDYQSIIAAKSSYTEVTVYGDYPNSNKYGALSADAFGAYFYFDGDTAPAIDLLNSGQIVINSWTKVGNNATTTQQISAANWSDMSSSSGGYGLFAGNAYLNAATNAFTYSTTHASIGAIGFAVNYPTWNKAAIIGSNTASATAGNTFSPITIMTWLNTGGVGINNDSPTSLLHVAGTYTTSNNNFTALGGTLNSSSTGAHRAFNANVSFNPSGGSITSILSIDSSPIISGSSLTISSVTSFFSSLVLQAGYSGTVTTAYGYYAADVTISGGSISAFNQFNAAVTTLNNNAASGTKTNRQFNASGSTAGSAGGTVNNYGMQITLSSGGSSSGTTNNRGIYITGNGGTASGGTVNNFAFYSDSTAPSLFSGTITFPTPFTLGATSVTSTGTQLNYLNAATGTTGTTSTNIVFSTSPTLVTPILGTPTSGTLTNCTGLPISTGVSGLGTGVATFLATPSSANLRAALTDESGTGVAYFQGGDLGTPTAGVLTNATGLPISTGVSGLAAGVATFLATPSSANLRAALTDEVGTGAAYFVGGALGTPASGTLTSCTGLPISTGVSGLATNVATFLATPSSANLRAALTDESGTGVAYFQGGDLGTPSAGVLTNATGLPINTGLSGYPTATPVQVGSVAQAAGSRAVWVSGHYAYTSCSATTPTHGFEIFDITIPTAPVKVGGLDLAAAPVGNLVVSGNIAFVCVNSTTHALQIIDVVNPAAPTLIKDFNVGGNVGATLAVSAGYVYHGHGGVGTNFRVIDVSDPANPVTKSALSLTGASGLAEIALQGKYAFVAGGQAVAGTAGLWIVDISDPINPSIVATYNAVSSPRGVQVAGKYCYVGESVAANGLEVVDVSNPASPVQVAVFATDAACTAANGNILIGGDYLYFPGQTSTQSWEVINISNPASPSKVAIVNTGSNVQGAAISGPYGYLTSNGSLRVYDLFGGTFSTLRAGAFNTDILNVDGKSIFQGDIYAQKGLSVGLSGIFSRGTLSVYTPNISATTPVSAIFKGGRVGIGTETPDVGLDVETALGNTLVKAGAAFPVYLISAQASVGFNAYFNSGWKFGAGSTAHYGGYFGFNQTTGDLAYSTSTTTGAADGAITSGGRFIISQGGNVGIGTTTTPQAMLHVGVGSPAGSARFYNAFADASNGEWGEISWNSNVLWFGTNKNGTGVTRNMQFNIGGTKKGDYGVTTAATWTFQDSLEVLTNLGIGGIPQSRFSITGFYGSVASGFSDSSGSGIGFGVGGFGFNVIRTGATSAWNLGTDTASNGGGFIDANLFGSLRFYCIASTGGTSKVLTDVQMQAAQVGGAQANGNWFFAGMLQFVGITNAFPAWKRSGTTIQARLADDSGDASLSSGTLTVNRTINRGVTNDGLLIYGGSVNDGANIELYGSTAGGIASFAYYDAAVHTFRDQAGSANKLDWNGTNANAWTMAGALKITSNTGATEGSVLNVDAVAGFATSAKFGTNLPIYMMCAQPIIGMNMYWNGSNFVFGKGSVSGTNYAGIHQFVSTTGTHAFQSTTATGNADATGTLQTVLQVDRNGLVAFGPGSTFSNTFPALKRSGTTLAHRLADDSADGPMSASTATLSGLTLGSVLFAGTGGLISQDNANLFWDDTNNRLGIGVTSPDMVLDVEGLVGNTTAKFGPSLPLYTVSNNPALGFNAYFNTNWIFGVGSTAHYAGAIGFNTTTGAFAFNVSNATGAAAGTATMNQPIILSQTSGTPTLALTGVNGQSTNAVMLTEVTTIAAAATTSTTIQIPARALVFGVTVRVTVAIPTATTFNVGVTGAATRYGTGIAVAANTIFNGTPTDNVLYYAAGTSILITPNATPGTNVGRVRVTIHYITLTAPTS